MTDSTDPGDIRELEQHLKTSRQEYAEYLKGKRVAVVGPAPSILGSKQEETLKQYDVIVRLNKAVPVPEDLRSDVGSRTDVLYNCMNPSEECGGNIDINLLHKEGVKFLVSPYAPYQKYRFARDINYFGFRNLKHQHQIRFCHIDSEYFARLMTLIKLPNTGISAILDLLQHEIKELYITGFTFFKGGYVKQYRTYNEQQVLARMARYQLHDQERQLHYMRTILRDNPRVKMDAALSQIIQEDKNVSFKVDPRLVRALPKKSSMDAIQLKITEKLKSTRQASKPHPPATSTDKSRSGTISKPQIPLAQLKAELKPKPKANQTNTPLKPKSRAKPQVKTKPQGKAKPSSAPSLLTGKGRKTIDKPKIMNSGRRKTLK